MNKTLLNNIVANKIVIPSFLIFNFTFFIVASAFAADPITISGGGAASTAILQLTGQSAIGAFPGGGGLGGIYTRLGTMGATIEGVPRGTIPLHIIRNNADIFISWETTIINPDIYMLTGEGSGQYVSDVGWQKVLSGGSLTPFGRECSFSFVWSFPNELEHTDQVGRGFGEVYYKGLIAGVDPAATNSDTGLSNLASARAVGKVNIAVNGTTDTLGKNIISIPFNSTDLHLSHVFGEGTDSVWREGDMIQYKVTGSPSYLTAIYTSNRWRNAADPSSPPAFDVDYRQGYFILTRNAKIFTVLGSVINVDTVALNIYSGAGLPTGGKTLLGMVYPVQVGLTSTGLSTGASERDLIQYKVDALSPSYISAVYSGGVWVNAANPRDLLSDSIAQLKVPFGYTYVRFGDSGFTFTRRKPF
jgi:hypothetical protein